MGTLYLPTIKDLEETILGYELMIARFERQIANEDLDSAAYTEVLQTMDGLQIELAKDRERRMELLTDAFR